MSSLRPDGVAVNFGGVDRRFLFSFEVIDELQSRFTDKNIFAVLEEAGNDTFEGLMALLDVVEILSNAWPNTAPVSKQEVAQLLKKGELAGIRFAISRALQESMPDAEPDDTPRPETDGIIDVARHLLIAMSKWHMSEKEAWRLTLRKFSLLNDAFLYISGAKKDEELMPLSALP